jgi:hypothetical protein
VLDSDVLEHSAASGTLSDVLKTSQEVAGGPALSLMMQCMMETLHHVAQHHYITTVAVGQLWGSSEAVGKHISA